jgi:hypothetical protein
MGDRFTSSTIPGSATEDRGVYFCSESARNHRDNYSNNSFGSYGMNAVFSTKRRLDIASPSEVGMLGDGQWNSSDWSKSLNPGKPEMVHKGFNLFMGGGNLQFIKEAAYDPAVWIPKERGH